MKRFFITLFAFCMAASTIIAQNNTYNMQITLANGTTVSIGANEIKSIAFDNGQISVDGQRLEDIIKSVSDQTASIDALKSQIDRTNTSLATLQADLVKRATTTQIELEEVKANLATKVSTISKSINSILDDVTPMKSKLEALSFNMRSYATVESVETAIKELKEELAKAGQGDVSAAIKNLEESLAKQSNEIAQINNSINQLKAEIQSLKEGKEGENDNPGGEDNPSTPVTPTPEGDGVSAYYAGGAVMQMNDLIQSGSQLNWTFKNGGSKAVTLTGMQLINGKTNSVGANLLTENVVVEAGKSVSYTIKVGIFGIESPKVRFTYLYDGEERTIEAEYKDFHI